MSGSYIYPATHFVQNEYGLFKIQSVQIGFWQFFYPVLAIQVDLSALKVNSLLHQLHNVANLLLV